MENFTDIQRAVAQQVDLADTVVSPKTICAFDCAQHHETIVCAAVVVSFPEMRVVEQKHLVKKAPMPYVPGLLAFREGPLMLELYYSLESEPELLMIDGHGIAHPEYCGIATFVGVELAKPAIGVAKSKLVGEEAGEDILFGGQVVGKLVKLKPQAKPLWVSPGNLISIETSERIVRECARVPHKMPEPLHLAHRYAEKVREQFIISGDGNKIQASAPLTGEAGV